jgi:hypothetical protein
MDRQKLSARARQPGHDRTFEVSETNFIDTARECLDPKKYEIVFQPRDLRAIFTDPVARSLGLRPEAKIENRATGRKFFVEVKKQAAGGNAEERSYKHHTVQFYKTLHDAYDYDYHPYVTIWCEELATLRKYTQKVPYLIEPDQYFLWVDYDRDALCAYIQARCRAWIDPR